MACGDTNWTDITSFTFGTRELMLMHTIKFRLDKRTSMFIGIRPHNHFVEDLLFANTSIQIFITGAYVCLFLEIIHLMLFLNMAIKDAHWAYFLLFTVFTLEFMLIDCV